MTGGKAIILGKTGRNFGAGMSGGVAYVLDADGTFPAQCNMEMIGLEKVETPEEQAELRAMIEKHLAKTGSAVAEYILSDWEYSLSKFVKVRITSYNVCYTKLLRPLDRQMTTDLLGFEQMNYNVVYAQMGRGKMEKIVAFALSSIAATLSKMAYDA